jgi:hypothetical protein
MQFIFVSQENIGVSSKFNNSYSINKTIKKNRTSDMCHFIIVNNDTT